MRPNSRQAIDQKYREECRRMLRLWEDPLWRYAYLQAHRREVARAYAMICTKYGKT